MIDKIIKFFLNKRIIAGILLLVLLGYGISVMPFDIETFIPRDPVPVDAIPDIGENQQIVFTKWAGRSPKDVEDQITYPLTVELMGIPGIKTIRASSMLGFSSIYIIFKDKVDFYWSRSRILEKLSTARKSLPQGVSPAIGPDATALGQVFWYTVEGKGFNDHELRSIQDWNIKYALQSVEGVSEVGSIGGKVREYQIDIDPDSMKAYNITLPELVQTIKQSNIDVGAGTIEINRAEYVVRGLGFIRNIDDLKNSVIKSINGTPITLSRVAKVFFGPQSRRGALDKEGAEAVGAVVVTRYGANPMEVIKRVKQKIKEISPGLPTRHLKDGSISQAKIVPFYDRTQLINETLNTLQEALSQQILITVLVVIAMLWHLSSSILISGLLPLAVLMAFIGMKQFGVDTNLMSLAGIAIAIGTMVDMGIILCENILKHINDKESLGKSLKERIFAATSEVGSAVLTAVLTTIVSFLPVFSMSGPEGKLFKPLAYTKTFALISSLFIALIFIPVASTILFKEKSASKNTWLGFTVAGIITLFISKLSGICLIAAGLLGYGWQLLTPELQKKLSKISISIAVIAAALLLTYVWMPLGQGYGIIANLIAVSLTCASLLGFFKLFIVIYEPLLTYFLEYKARFLFIPAIIAIWGLSVWLGFSTIAGWIPGSFEMLGIETGFIRNSSPWKLGVSLFPGLGKEFMPPLDEGSYLLMPTTMPHASIAEALDVLSKQDRAIKAIPEVESAVGKIGRVDSPLDPAPLSMIETIITYKPEYSKPDPKTGIRKRQWREHIKSPNDIWKEIVKASKIPGTTSAPKLQPIAARLVMLQTGIRAPMGIQISGPDLGAVENLGFKLETELKHVKGVEASTVTADQVVGKPYIEIDIDRTKAARHGIKISAIQQVIETALGGKTLAYTIEGRERYGIRIRYARELRDSPEMIKRIPVTAPDRTRIPLSDIAELKFIRGPQVIKSENTFPVGYVIFDKKTEFAETNVVENAQKYLSERIKAGKLTLPAGTSFKFIGNYQNQVRAEKRLSVILPLSLLIIFLILYLEFSSASVTFLVFTGIGIAWCGGFIMLWLYSQSWFMNFTLFGISFRELLNMGSMNLSVAVWVGFIALFGIASDDGVVMASYLETSFNKTKPKTIKDIRKTVIAAGMKRIRPCLMTTATTILALLPILTSSGRGADVMIPMAIPTFGGMCIELITLFVVPIGYCLLKEIKSKKSP